MFGHTAVRRARFLEVGGFDEGIRWTSDWELWARLILSGSAIGLVDEPLATYRLHEATLSAKRLQQARGRLMTCGRILEYPTLTPSERERAQRTADSIRREIAWGEAKEAILERADDARSRSRCVMNDSEQSVRVRAFAALSAVAPAITHAILVRRQRRYWVGAGGLWYGAHRTTPWRPFTLSHRHVPMAAAPADTIRRDTSSRSSDRSWAWSLGSPSTRDAPPRSVPTYCLRAVPAPRRSPYCFVTPASRSPGVSPWRAARPGRPSGSHSIGDGPRSRSRGRCPRSYPKCRSEPRLTPGGAAETARRLLVRAPHLATLLRILVRQPGTMLLSQDVWFWAGVRSRATPVKSRRLTKSSYVVLCYHQISPGGAPTDWELDVPAAVFRRQLRLLRRLRWVPLSLGEILRFHQDPTAVLGRRRYLVTADDGFVDAIDTLQRATHAHPVAFVVTNFVAESRSENGNAAFADWDRVREAPSAGVTESARILAGIHSLWTATASGLTMSSPDREATSSVLVCSRPRSLPTHMAGMISRFAKLRSRPGTRSRTRPGRAATERAQTRGVFAGSASNRTTV